jgi:hypothetical protein
MTSRDGIPDDIYLAVLQWDLVRRGRISGNKKPAEAGSCASSLTVNRE